MRRRHGRGAAGMASCSCLARLGVASCCERRGRHLIPGAAVEQAARQVLQRQAVEPRAEGVVVSRERVLRLAGGPAGKALHSPVLSRPAEPFTISVLFFQPAHLNRGGALSEKNIVMCHDYAAFVVHPACVYSGSQFR